MAEFQMLLTLVVCSLTVCGVVLGDQFCTPYPTADPSPTSKAPPMPTLPQSYHIHVEAKLLESGYTADSVEFYDQEQNKASLVMNYADTKTSLFYSYDTNELFNIKDDKICTVTKLSDDHYNFIFGETVDNGKYKVYSAGDGFRFGKKYGEKYMGSSVVRGIPCDHWQSCINWVEKSTSMTVDYYFAGLNWTTVTEDQQVPVRAEVQGVVGTSGNSHTIHHVYDFYHYRPNHESRHDDAHDFETPAGVVCPGRNKTRPVPQLQGQYYYREEIVVPQANLILGYDVWYDSSYRLVRWDYRNSAAKAPFWNTNPVTEIHDFNTGVAYVIDKLIGNCTIQPIEESTFDVVETKTGQSPDANGSPRYSVRFKTPQELFFLDDSYNYQGQRTFDGKLCDVFVSNKSDFVIPGTTGPYSSIFEFYFLADSWKEEPNDGLYTTSDYPVALTIAVDSIEYTSYYKFYDFNEYHPDLKNFDISPCFSQDSTMDIEIHFPGQYFPVVDKNKKTFELEARLGISKYASISPIRIQRSSFHFDSWSFYMDVTLLNRAPTSAKFHKYKGKVLESSNDKTVTNVNNPDYCAYLCLTETSFQCQSFDLCFGKNLCYLSKSTADDGQLISNQYCYHYSRNIVDKTITEVPTSEAYDVLKDLIYRNMFAVEIPQPANKKINYRAMSIRNNIVRDPNGLPTKTSGQKLKEFTSMRNKALQSNNDDMLPGVTVDDCAAACVDEDIFFCQSFEYCFNTGDCRLSKRHPAEVPALITDSNNCDLFSRNYTYKFTKRPGTYVAENTKEWFSQIQDVNICAKLCTDLQAFNCKSFQFCATLGGCALSPNHFLDVPIDNAREEPFCDHYTRNYLDDFKFMQGKQLALTNNEIIEGASVAECAKNCAERGATCQGFDFCGNDTICRITSASVKNIGQITIESSAYCNHYSRQYYLDGSQVTSHSLQNQKDSSLIYGNGSMAAIGIIMLLIGCILTVAGYMLYMKFARGRSIDDMKQGFVNMDILSKE